MKLHHAFLDTEVVDGEDVFAPESEDQDHLHRPTTHTLDLSQEVDDLIVTHALELDEGDLMVEEELGNVFDVLNFIVRESDLSQDLVRSFEDHFGRGFLTTEEVEKAPTDHPRHRGRELLAHDGRHKTHEDVLLFRWKDDFSFHQKFSLRILCDVLFIVTHSVRSSGGDSK